MSTKSKARGTETERMVVNYLLENGFPKAERRALAGSADKGDVTGIEGVCIEVKGDRSNKVSAWKKETIAEAENARVPMYLLIVRIDRKPVERWEAHIPWNLCGDEQVAFSMPPKDYQWVRMDLRLAVEFLRLVGYT